MIAVVLVVGGFFVRRDVIEGDDGDTPDGGTTDEVGAPPSSPEVCTDLIAAGAAWT